MSEEVTVEIAGDEVTVDVTVSEGNDGWSPILAVVSDGARRVHQVIDWTNGQGAKPPTGKYVGATGLVDLIADGVDVRGAAGVAGTNLISTSTASNITGAIWGTGTGIRAGVPGTDFASAAQGALAATAVQPNTTPAFTGITLNGNISGGAAEPNLAATGWKINGYWYWDGAAVGFYPIGTAELAIASAGRIRFNSASTNVFVGGGACLAPMTNGIRVIDATSGDRDFQARDLIATQYIRPASYTVAAANALSSPPAGAAIYVSNESGGACWAYRRGSDWLRFADNAVIS
jgi:hypothetical protein